MPCHHDEGDAQGKAQNVDHPSSRLRSAHAPSNHRAHERTSSERYSQ